MAVTMEPFSLIHAERTVGPANIWKHLKKASWFSKLSGKVVRCDLCHHECLLKNRETGRRRSRINMDGTLYSMTFHRTVAIHADPVEKLPMRHVLPGQNLLSIGTARCTFSCLYCINSKISQKSPKQVEFMDVSGKDPVNIAKNISIEIQQS